MNIIIDQSNYDKKRKMSWFYETYDVLAQKSSELVDIYKKDLTDFATTVTSETGEIIHKVVQNINENEVGSSSSKIRFGI